MAKKKKGIKTSPRKQRMGITAPKSVKISKVSINEKGVEGVIGSPPWNKGNESALPNAREGGKTLYHTGREWSRTGREGRAISVPKEDMIKRKPKGKGKLNEKKFILGCLRTGIIMEKKLQDGYRVDCEIARYLKGGLGKQLNWRQNTRGKWNRRRQSRNVQNTMGG